MRDDTAEALGSIRQAAAEWSDVKDDPVARDHYFDKWSRTVRAAFQRPASKTPPKAPVALGR